MGTVTITEYKLPDGRQEPREVELEDKYSAMAKDMRLSCEVLRDDTCAFYASYPEDEEYSYEEVELVFPPSTKEQHITATHKVIEERFKKGRNYNPEQDE